MQGGSQTNFWGGLIVSLRRERGLSQRQLAAMAKVNRSTLRRIEEGTARGDIDLIEKLLDVAGYELEAMTKEALEERAKRAAEMAADPDYRSHCAVVQLCQLLPAPS